MTQERLSNIAILHVHKEETEKLDVKEVMKLFVDVHESRGEVFGVVS